MVLSCSDKIIATGTLNVINLHPAKSVISWRIEKVGNAFEQGTLISPNFDCFDSVWCLTVNWDITYSSRLDLRLKKMSAKSSHIFLRVYLDYSQKEFLDTYGDRRLFSFNEISEHSIAVFFEPTRSGPNYFHPNDFLAFSLELELGGLDSEPLSHGVTHPTGFAGAVCLSKDVLTLFTDCKNCDVILIAGGTEFPVHRLLLGARSRVFEAMFEYDMKESQSGVVHITDLSSKTMSNLLLYVYSDKIRDLSYEETCDLYLSAEKYQFKDLKERCTEILIAQLSVVNACDIALIGDQYNDKKLVDSVKKYASENHILMTTREWLELAGKRPRLASEILLSASSEFTKRRGVGPLKGY